MGFDALAIAAYAARGKQYIVELRPYETGLVMHQLRYADAGAQTRAPASHRTGTAARRVRAHS